MHKVWQTPFSKMFFTFLWQRFYFRLTSVLFQVSNFDQQTFSTIWMNNNGWTITWSPQGVPCWYMCPHCIYDLWYVLEKQGMQSKYQNNVSYNEFPYLTVQVCVPNKCDIYFQSDSKCAKAMNHIITQTWQQTYTPWI